jgi:hypothetical protein
VTGVVAASFESERVDTTTQATPSPWVRGPAWDGVWMLPAVWLVPVVLWLGLRHGDAEGSPLDVLYLVLTAFFWIGHRVSSAYLVWGTAAYRPLLRAQPVRFVVLPLLVTAACFAVLLPPDDVLPLPRAERFVLLAILDYGFAAQHFAAQHFGALSLYRTRVGGGARTRRLDRLFALGVGGVLVIVADLLVGSVAYQDRWVDGWLSPSLVASAEDGIRGAATVALLVLTGAMLAAELRAPRRSGPRVLYVLGLATMVALALHARSPFLFLVVWSSQHWIVATGLASETAAPARSRAVLLALVVASVLLLPFFEVEASFDGSPTYGPWIFGSFADAVRTSSWVPALLALGFASGFVHYLLDRSVYRFSDPAVRAAASGLFRNDAAVSRRLPHRVSQSS